MTYDTTQLLLTIIFDLIGLIGVGLFSAACVRATYRQDRRQKEEELVRYRAAATALAYLLKHVERTPTGYSLTVEVLNQARKLYRQEN